jgi:hypothetical protein
MNLRTRAGEAAVNLESMVGIFTLRPAKLEMPSFGDPAGGYWRDMPAPLSTALLDR